MEGPDAARRFRRREGASIILTGSTAGLMQGITEMPGNTGGVGYSWAKQTLVRYTEVVALQLAQHSIRLNAIHPTNVDTQLLQNDSIQRVPARPGEPDPGGRRRGVPVLQAMPIPYIQPSDVTGLVPFLASDDARYITGQNFRIDAGGMVKGTSAF